MLSRRLTRTIAVGFAAVAVGGSAYGILNATAGNGSAAAGTTPNVAKLGSNARSGPASGGASGTVASVSTSRFTMSTLAGQKLTVSAWGSTGPEAGPRAATSVVVGAA